MSADVDAKRTRNPAWSRDELVVTLDFYLRHTPSIPAKASEEILELSLLLNRLREQLGTPGDEKFRNPNGVYMKLMNFRHLDPSHESTGLSSGGRGDQIVWDLYANRPDELRRVSDAIHSFAILDNVGLNHPPDDDDDLETEEGQLLTRVHRFRERSRVIVERKKDAVLKRTGRCNSRSNNPS